MSSLTTTEYVTKCEKRRDNYLLWGERERARSMQLKIDNALMISPRGRLSYSEPIINRKPNRKERRKDVQGKPKAARDQNKILSHAEVGSPADIIGNKERSVVQSACRDLYNFIRNDLTWGSKVSDNDEIIIYSKEPIQLPATHRGFVVINRVGKLTESAIV